MCVQLPLRGKWQSCNTVHCCGVKKNQLETGIRTQHMLRKIAEESVVHKKKNEVCLGNLTGRINHDIYL